MNKLKIIIKTLTGLVFLSCSYAAQSAVLEIQFTGLDLVYDGTDIFDKEDIAAGNGNPAEADELTAMIFLVDGAEVGRLDTDIFADVIINDVLNIPMAGGTVTTGDGHFDLLTTNNTPGWGLALDFAEASITYVVGGGLEIAIFGAAATTIFNQDLSFLNLVVGDPVTFSFSSTNFKTGNENGFLNRITASSDGTVTATVVPVPAAVWLFGSGLIAMVGIARRRKAA